MSHTNYFRKKYFCMGHLNIYRISGYLPVGYALKVLFTQSNIFLAAFF